MHTRTVDLSGSEQSYWYAGVSRKNNHLTHQFRLEWRFGAGLCRAFTGDLSMTSFEDIDSSGLSFAMCHLGALHLELTSLAGRCGSIFGQGGVV